MHGSFFKNLYYNFSRVAGAELPQDQGEEGVWEESELRFEKPGLFEFRGQNEMTILSSKKGMVAECAWPELFYRKLVVGFLGALFLTCLVKVF